MKPITTNISLMDYQKQHLKYITSNLSFDVFSNLYAPLSTTLRLNINRNIRNQFK